MQGNGQAGVPLRPGKKMRKRRELDALVSCGGGAHSARSRGAGGPLLGGSSDEREEWTMPMRARPTIRKRRSACAPACAALLLCACATATATVVWLFIDVRDQITSLRSQVQFVSEGSQVVEDALHKCHSAVRELQHNNSEMSTRLDELYTKTENLTQQVSVIQSSLLAVKQQVASAPELTSMPQQLTAMETSVARFGSQIKDLDSRVSVLRTQTSSITDSQNILTHNITDINSEIERLWNKTMLITDKGTLKDLEPIMKKQGEFQNSITQLSSNITLMNETLSTRIKWATQDFENDHHKVTGLLESVQNNSAAVSSLQTAWHTNNEIISRNITEIHQMIADKEAQIQRQRLEIKELQKIVENMNTNVPPSAENSESQNNSPSDVKTIHERDSAAMVNTQKMHLNSTQLPPQSSEMFKRIDPPKIDASKPNILSAGTA